METYLTIIRGLFAFAMVVALLLALASTAYIAWDALTRKQQGVKPHG